MDYLVDTNVISEVLRSVPNTHVATWASGVTKQTLFISVVSLGEIQKGLTIMPAGVRRIQLAQSIEQLIPAWFAGRVLPITRNIAERSGVLEGQRQLQGRPLHIADAQIAATALLSGLTLVTRNTRDFEGLGLTILNPWG